MSRAERRMYALMQASLVTLMVLCAWLVWLSLPGSDGAVLATAIILVLPLAIPLPWLWRRSRYAAVCATFLLTPYLAFAVMEITVNPAMRLPGGLVLLMILLTLIALVGWLRTSRPRAA
ncbi:MAG: DUF2069 domain-containing protein [Gammaproteobacteria bacterium]|nr:MAG: DUF2069 domain-containing protein [Gammaproteobacteria bacterium]